MTNLKLVFGPGCFDEFEGTQEELDNLVAELHKQTKSGEILNNAQQLDMFDEEAVLVVTVDSVGKGRKH